MSSTSETGHAKNVANFEELVTFVTSYGVQYSPTKAALTLNALNNLLQQAKDGLTNVTTLSVAFNNNTNDRVNTFEPLRKLSTRLVNALIATDADSEKVKDAKSTNLKLQGKRAAKVLSPSVTAEGGVDPNTPIPKTISASQQSYDQRIEHFSKLIEILKSEPSYNPNEIALQTSTLTQMLSDMKAANTHVFQAYADISNARIARNKTLYQDKTGLYPVAIEVKNYIKSLFGASAPEYKQISKINFKEIIM